MSEKNKRLQIAVIAIPLLILAVIAMFLYNKFFAKISYDEANIPAAEIFRVSPPEPLPNIYITDQVNEKINFKKFKGKNILLNFWATWCQPCIKELPQIDSLVDIIGEDNIEVVAVSIDSDKSVNSLKNFLDNLNIKNLDLYMDKDLSASEAIKMFGVPTTLLIDKNLNIHLKVSGYINWHDPQIINLINGLP